VKKVINIYILPLFLTILLILLPVILSGQSVFNKAKRFSGTWEVKQSLPIPITGGGSAVAGGKLYVIGGTSPWDESINKVFEYNPSTDKWTEKADAPYPGGYYGCAAANGHIYIFGGYYPKNNLDNAAVYYPETDTWSEVSRLPYPPRRNPAAVFFENRIFLLAGMAAGVGMLNNCDVYLPEFDAWLEGGKADVPVKRDVPAAALYSRKIYFFGGLKPYSGSQATSFVYDIDLDMWEEIAPMPTPKWAHRCETVNNWIYVLGGATEGRMLSNVEAYDPENDVWLTLPPMPVACSHFMTGVIDDKIYVAGGGNFDGLLNSLYVYMPGSPEKSITITNIYPDSAFIHEDIVIEGYGFGNERGTGYVSFGGIRADRYYEWSSRRIKAEVPMGAVSGNVYVEADTKMSNEFYLTVLDSISEYKVAGTPLSIDLKQNFPNPFNSSTAFTFSVPVEDYVQLDIFNLNGKIIKSLLNRWFSPGEYQCSWNGKDNNENNIASGIYIARIRMNDNSADYIKLTYIK